MLDLLLLAQDAAAAPQMRGFWDVVNANMTAILATLMAIVGAIGAALVGLGKLIYAIAMGYIDRRNKRLQEEAEAEQEERDKRCELLDRTIAHIPLHTQTLEDTCRVLESLRDDHRTVHEAAVPALDAVIAMGERPETKVGSDVIRDLKNSRHILKGREQRDAEREARFTASREKRRKSTHPDLEIE